MDVFPPPPSLGLETSLCDGGCASLLGQEKSLGLEDGGRSQTWGQGPVTRGRTQTWGQGPGTQKQEPGPWGQRPGRRKLE
ncbi:hypothetical protein YC2023_052587 [Brassica napus]